MDLVTGATGFVGSHLLYHLLSKGHRVRATHRKDSDFALLNRVFQFYNSSPENFKERLEWVESDINDLYALKECMEGVKDIYHAAGKVSFQPLDRQMLMKVNIEGTANIVNLALEHNIRKLCYVSSTAALGRAEMNGNIDETVTWKTSGRNSQYAVSKYGGEREVWRGIEEGLNAVIVNPGIILGPGEISSGSARLIQVVEDGLKFYTKGTNSFVDVRDVVEIMLRLMEHDISAERYVVTAETLDYKTLFGEIAVNLGKPAPQWAATKWMGSIAWRWYYLRYLVTGKKPLITRETAMTAAHRYRYPSDKIQKALDYQFIPVSKSIEDACAFHLKRKRTT